VITFDVDATALHAGLADLTLDLAARTKAAAEVTASMIVREAQGRVARRTRATARGIHYEESREGTGWVVLAVRADSPNVPFFLEFGTRYMTARPFLYASAAVEYPGHERRVAEATETSIDITGFGGS
jgi:hypothetical protein